MTDIRPTNCRHRLQDEGKAYPRSSCPACGRTITTGLGKRCYKETEALAAMTDTKATDLAGLVERLRDRQIISQEVEDFAATAIEQLQRERDGYRNLADANGARAKEEHDRAERAEALLEKARGVIRRSTEGWSNAVELGLIPERHTNTATILADEGRAILAELEAKP